jgi:ectoine hydroxylase
MNFDQIAKTPARTLSEAQRRQYFEDGYLLVERAIPADILSRLQQASDRLVQRSRDVSKSDKVFDIEPDHRADNPRLRRVSSPQDQDPVFWELATESVLPDIIADLVGPDVKFHHSKLNFKWKKGGQEVKWHYDICSWPHTDYSPLTVGVYLHDCDMEQGPLGVVPGSHDLPLFNQYGDNGEWLGYIPDKQLATLDLQRAKYLTGPAGSITIHNCRTVHGSPANNSDVGRPLLLYTFSSADSFAYTPNPIPSPKSGAIVRGQRAEFSNHDPRPCLMPPDWSAGYTSIFSVQETGAKSNATM